MSAVARSRSFELDLSARGYQVLFRPNETNRCPGCGHAQWLVGRITAECVVCNTALPLAGAEWSGGGARAVALHIVRGTERSQEDEKRRAPREPGNGRVLCLFVDGAPHPFAIRNISSGGVMGELPPGAGEGSALSVELEDGSLLPAEIRWSDGNIAGLAFVAGAAAKPGKER